jgi:hypothetical protein
MKKNTLALVGLLALLLVLAYLVLQKPGEQSVGTSGSGTFLSVDSLSLDKISIKSPTASLVLEKRGAEWFVAEPVNYKADQANATNLIHLIKSMEARSVVSSKPEKRPVFQVDSTGTLLTLFEKGKQTESVVIGKMGSSYNETYVRKSNSDDVVLVDGVTSYSFSRPVKDWRDKTIFTTLRENIKEVKYEYGDTTFTLAWHDSAWWVGKDPAKEEAVNGLLTTLSNLQADDFVDSALAPAPKVTSQISYAGIQVRFGTLKGNTRSYIQTSNSPQWFALEQWRANDVLKRKKDLLKSAK